MPVLKDFRQTRVITLPSFPDSKVEIYSALLVRDMTNFNFAKGEDDAIKFILEKLPLYIKSWNFDDEVTKQTMEINADNLGFLKEDDLIYLVNQITEFQLEVKKK